MAPNTKNVLVPDVMSPQGIDILKARDDIEVVVYHPFIATPDLHALLAEASGIALSSTPYRKPQMDA